ncbi:MAG: FtsX-like permease family protein [Anaerolineaceae bacterium]|nr:FtsX-like permease family protein [Anaerolineaceae bacterium]
MNVPLARRNLLHDRSKLILSVLGVAASLTLIVLLLGFRNGLYKAITAYLDNISADLLVTKSGIQGAFTASNLPITLHDTLGATAGVVEIDHVLVGEFIFSQGNVKMPAVLVGYNIENGIGGPWKMSEGRGIQADDEVVFDASLARKAGINIGDKITLLNQPFRVVGLSRETVSWLAVYLFISRSAAEKTLQLPGIASYYALRLPPGSDLTAVANAIEKQFPNVEVFRPNQKTDASVKIVATVLDTPINLMLGISIVIGIAVMGLTAYTTIVDRMREYGVLKAVGATGEWLYRLVITETFYQAGLGFTVGTIFSYGAAQIIMVLFPQFIIIIYPETLALTGVIALVMSVLAALLPIRRLGAVDPAVAFRA